MANTAATLHALLAERDEWKRLVIMVGEEIDHIKAAEAERDAARAEVARLQTALTEWREEPAGGISKAGIVFLHPERVAALVGAARCEEREACAEIAEWTRNRAEHAKQRARDDFHQSETDHQEGRWHASNDIEDAIRARPTP
jgi:hypothetical protein